MRRKEEGGCAVRGTTMIIYPLTCQRVDMQQLTLACFLHGLD